MRVKIQRIFVVLFIFYSALGCLANEQIGSYMNEYYEVLALAGIVERPTLIYQSLSRNAWQLPPANVDHPWKLRMEREKAWNRSEGANWNIISPELLLSYNTTYAQGFNDGSFWQGKGANSMISGGLNISWKWLSATLAPELWFSQNLEFDLMPSNPSLSEYSYPNNGIDMPQRFGSDPVFDYGLGQSDLRLNIYWFTLGLSSENLWFGPAQVNPILMSNNASGFPHLDLGMRKVHTLLGDLELGMVWGSLIESDYFDADDSNDYRLFSALTFGYSFPFLDSLTLGLSRVVYTPWKDLRFYDLVKIFDPRMTLFGSVDHPGTDDRDQMISFTIDWFLPKAMFNVYLEWARNDFSPDFRYLLSHPQHSQGYTLGFRKLRFTKNNEIFSITAEVTELARSKDIDDVCPSYYRHNKVIQGYTHLGQVMGASIGPGSNGQSISVYYYHKRGSVGLLLQRVAYDYDYYYAQMYPASWNPASNEVEFSLGIDSVVFINRIDLCFQSKISRFLNRNYEEKEDIWNFYSMISFRYNL